MGPDGFHPAVASWFRDQFPAATEVQRRAWRAIGGGSHTLISAPTGSGKTLAAFLAVIDTLVKRGLDASLPDETRILYVSPLKALSNDISKNLQAPLAGIRDRLLESGEADVCIRALVRTGDTTQSERAKMRRQAPHILVTTPESLYILLTSESGRRMLGTVETVIVDEIHALAGNKRGAHLAVSLERLAALCGRPPVRVGVSATTKPMDSMVEFLIGADRAPCQVIDQGHVRNWDLRLELPSSPLEAIMANEVWVEIYDRLAALAADHRTTIVFVNTRRLAERVARHLADRCGEDQVTSHHGSLSKEHRLMAEERLKAGRLKVLVATASLELGIDIGEVDLVCQLGSPRGIARLLQRMGRSGHGVDRVPRGRLVPLSRDELVECVALLDSVARGELDAVALCRKPLDVLSQQIVAEVSMQEWGVGELFDLIVRSAPFRELSRRVYLDVLKMLANGFTTQRGRRGAYLHHDRVNDRLRPRRGARLTAVTNGGTIPDQFDHDVVMLPGELFVGTLNEDFAFESMPGDIFQLGNTSWRILKVHSGKVFVEDARGLPPTIPFWFGEAPGRSDELSAAVSRLRTEVDDALEDGSVADVADRLAANPALPLAAAEQLTEYLGAARAALDGLPTAKRIVIERFFDEAGDTHIVVHSPYGSRLNRAWGLALRKRFCRRFNFELQAAALEDTIVISLGVVHSFPLDEVSRYLARATVADVLTQAVLDAPIFPGRWRWNASVALAVRRFRNGKRAPAFFQRSDAEDLLATVFPDQLACAENLAGEREIPDHPLVSQTLEDCLRGVMDVDGLAGLLGRIEAGEVEVACCELTSPSPLAQEVLSAKPYAFLDDAPAEERRTLAIQARRHLTVEQAADLGRLDPEAIERVRSEAWPDSRDEDELHDALVVIGFMAPEEAGEPERSMFPGEAGEPARSTFPGEAGGPARSTFPQDAGGCGRAMFESLVADGRASTYTTPGGASVWVSAERVGELDLAVPGGRTEPAIDALDGDIETPEAALRELIRSRMEGLGPVTAAELGRPLGLSGRDVAAALAALEAEGFAMRGRFTERAMPTQIPSAKYSLASAGRRVRVPRDGESRAQDDGQETDDGQEEWCDRRLLSRIHRYTLKRLRSEIEPVTIADYQRFLFRWQGLGRERRQGSEALAAVIDELQGLALPAAAWEREVLPARLQDYSPLLMDELAVSGRIVWYRPSLRPQRGQADEGALRRGRGTVANSPIVILPREATAPWRRLAAPANGSAGDVSLSAGASRIRDLLADRGALFFQDLVHASGLLRVQTEEALAELVAGGLVTADAFHGLRVLITPPSRRRGFHGRRSRRGPSFDSAGRWALLEPAPADGSAGARSEAVEHAARAVLRRYGVVCRGVLQRESNLPGWRDLLGVFRRLEARGEIRGGRFVGALGGEQFALSSAVELLRRCRREARPDEWVVVSAADPLNLEGILTPGGRVASIHSHRLLYKGGIAVATLTAAGLQWLEDLDGADRRRAEMELRGRAAARNRPRGSAAMSSQVQQMQARLAAARRDRMRDEF